MIFLLELLSLWVLFGTATTIAFGALIRLGRRPGTIYNRFD